MSDKVNFCLIGLAGTIGFQKCLTYIEMLNHKKPEMYPEPQIRPMLEYDWEEYLISAKRKYGNQFWTLKKPLVVFVNGEYLGDDDDLMQFLGEYMQIRISRDYDCMAKDAVREIFKKYREIGRRFVFFTFTVNGQPIGTMIFMLYADLVPKTSKRFIRRCQSKHNGYKGKSVHRIMDRGWIQFGGYDLMPESVCCENYKVPHNRRGVLSMCNNNRHLDNSTQFFVCLNPTPWMDYRYVAFGQLIQGEKVLQTIEKLKTKYQKPKDEIRIIQSGELNIYNTSEKTTDFVDKYIETRKLKKRENIYDIKCISSNLRQSYFKRGFYSYAADTGGQLPLDNFPHSSTETNTPTSSLLSCGGFLRDSCVEEDEQSKYRNSYIYQSIWTDDIFTDNLVSNISTVTYNSFA